ncbi:hypothetical protein K402DRAFT_447708 [Aulographum hederae CBS 113979]|uniref:Apolipoprotein/apolipophorin n=1 Tax=Aulographum hederae CBS 113979 TaxID=1176131 RepID=A0A6G1GUI6_9PEZI|nr:hypothetical protein K402DRAFT_447708 [Aulographum hederae CBS 113979]
MFASRSMLRSTRALRRQPMLRPRNARFQSTSKQSEGSFHPSLVGGLAGGLVAIAGGYAWYHFSGAKTIVRAAKSSKDYFSKASQKLQDNAPEPSEALQWLRQTAGSYASFIPGARGYIDVIFDDLEAIRRKHKDEVDSIVKEAYAELKDISKKGVSPETASESWDTLQTHMQRILELAGDAAEDIMNNHPDLKKQVGGNLDQLKQMGEKYGPEAKKQVDETWGQISDIIKSGVSADSAMKIKKLIQQKLEVVREMGDEAWKKGMEQAKPYLDESPKVKELVEKNAENLKTGDFSELYNKIKDAAESGKTDDLEQYVKNAADSAKRSGFKGLNKYLDQIPGGSEILPKLSELSTIANKHGKEAENLFKDTVNEISKVLSKKSEQAKKIAEKAEKEAK